MAKSKAVPPHERFRQNCKCDDCPSACCWYVKIAIVDSTALTLVERDDIRYYLMHDQFMVILRDNWSVYIQSKCQHIVENNGKFRCEVYDDRPSMCRQHGPESCTEKDWFLYGNTPNVIFTTVEEFDAWCDERDAEVQYDLAGQNKD